MTSGEVQRGISARRAFLLGGAGIVAATVGTISGGRPAYAADAVTTVNEKTGDVVLDAYDVDALPVVNVRKFGAVGDGITDDTQSFRDAIEDGGAGSTVYVPPGYDYKITDTIQLTASTSHTIWAPAGAVITQTNTDPEVVSFKAVGTVEGTKRMVDVAMPTTSSVVSVSNVSQLAEHDWVVVASGMEIRPGEVRAGYLRRIVGLTGNQLTLDAPPPRALPYSLVPGESTWLQKVGFLPSIRFIGGGQLRHKTPTTQYGTLIDLAVVNNPICDWELGPAGGAGFRVAHCYGGEFTGYAHDLLNDDKLVPDSDEPRPRHVGYGVDICGATRHFRAAGVATNVRHAITTNAAHAIKTPGGVTTFSGAGESEACLFETFASGCTNKAIDTHPSGINHQAFINVQGGEGGVQIRCDGFTILGGVIADTADRGVSVSTNLQIPAVIRNVTITNVYEKNTDPDTSPTGIQLYSKAIVEGCSISGVAGPGIFVATSAAGSTIQNINIQGASVANAGGISAASKVAIHSAFITDVVGPGILIAEGEAVAGSVIHDVTIVGVSGAEATGIQAGSRVGIKGARIESVVGRGVSIAAAAGGSTLEDVSVSGTSGENGAGIYAESKVAIQGARVTDATGQGVFIAEGEGAAGSVVHDVIISGVSGANPAGIRAGSRIGIKGARIDSIAGRGVDIAATAAGSTLEDISVVGMSGTDGTGIYAAGTVSVIGARISSCQKRGILIQSTAGGSVIMSAFISDGVDNNTIGLSLASSDNIVVGCVVKNVHTYVREADDVSDNDIDVRMVGGNRNDFQDYIHKGLGRMRQASTTPLIGAEVGSVAIENKDGDAIIGYAKLYSA